MGAYIVNPCPRGLVIETHASAVRASRVVVRVELSARDVTFVENAFGATGDDTWSVTVVGSDALIGVDGDTWIHNTVVIPAELCDVD